MLVQGDEELWQHLISLALQDPDSTGARNLHILTCLSSATAAWQRSSG